MRWWACYFFGVVLSQWGVSTLNHTLGLEDGRLSWPMVKLEPCHSPSGCCVKACLLKLSQQEDNLKLSSSICYISRPFGWSSMVTMFDPLAVAVIKFSLFICTQLLCVFLLSLSLPYLCTSCWLCLAFPAVSVLRPHTSFHSFCCFSNPAGVIFQG